ncbi:hypothetical protein [Amycolatopsis jiangsuensis]|uniref:Uncharacterized protein n=1 Tax=Amycolatopsis jiangsuensis TaxID=1181879 RepID=A0A840J8I8_9PSEU|nr:hypothetical protein [Amycolatopsis jiangsuensis]MBB4689804.1 hypothetical protein [Amycolatopsis jiangsuensis]
MSTPIAVLHEHGLTFHQTGPLKKAGYDTAEAVAELVDAHRDYAGGESALSRVPSMGPRRVALVCEAVDAWRENQAPRTPDIECQPPCVHCSPTSARRTKEDLTRRIERMTAVRDTYRTQADDLAAELTFVASRYLADDGGLRFSSQRCTGVSADALAWFGVGVRSEPEEDEYPRDQFDLSACERTFEMAPQHVQERMLPVLQQYRAAVAANPRA